MPRLLALTVLVICLSGCFVLPLENGYSGPPPRPAELVQHYSYTASFQKVDDEIIRQKDSYRIRRITLNTSSGETKIDFYQNEQPSEELIFVFPVLGGRPIMSRHFASYFARFGFDAAIVHRSNEFKKPEHFRSLEELFRDGVVRDRNAIDYFERVEGKTTFGSFGISRGGINVGITAGVDPRLEYNFIAMAGADLPNIFMESDERRIERYVKTVMEQENLSREEIRLWLADTIRSDPKYLAKYIDARKTMLMFGLCDNTVPYRYGKLLREEIGNPKTIYSFLGHRTSVIFTQVVELIPPFEDFCIIPPPYIESEALYFFRKSFGRGSYPLRLIPWKILQTPLNAFFYILYSII